MATPLPPSLAVRGLPELPALLTVDEVAVWLRTTPRAVYAMIGRESLPGVTRVGRRVLLRRDALSRWLSLDRDER